MSDLIPEIVLDKLWQGAGLSSYHPDGDQRFKLLNYGRDTVAETLARIPSGWNAGDPPVPKGRTQEFIVAVRRKSSAERVFVFAATYANEYDDDLSTRDGDGFIAHGWFNVGPDGSGEFDSFYEPMLERGDEVVGWQHLPKWDQE
jgi:hypothetical protein